MTLLGRHHLDAPPAQAGPGISSATDHDPNTDVLTDPAVAAILADDDGDSEVQFVRIGGVKIRTARAWHELNTAAQVRGQRGRRARRLLRREQRLRKISIERVVDFGGFDRPMPTSGGRGFSGPGGGRMRSIARLPEWRATSTQAAGLWPFSIGASAAMLGTPLGAHAITGEDVGFDPLVWFDAGGFMSAPIVFVLALNGFGKSSLVRRMATGVMAQGHTALFMGDTKSEYSGLTSRVGGQQIALSYHGGTINPLAVGALGSVVARLDAAMAMSIMSMASIAALQKKKTEVLEQVRARQVEMVMGLVQLNRRRPVHDFEETLVNVALERLYAVDGGGFTPDLPPILSDLHAVIDGSDQQLWPKVGADTAEQYREITRGLRQSLTSLIDGKFGRVFNAQTSQPIDLDAPAICVDLSGIGEADKKLLAAALMVCWSDGFGAVEAAHILSDVGLAPKRNFLVVMDELWRVLQAGSGMVDRVNALTRLNRTIGTGLIMITHSMKDLGAFESAADVNNARGFIERAPAKIIGPVGPDEIALLKKVTKFTATEEAWLTSLASVPPPSPATLRRVKRGERQKPQGLGCFLLKYGTSDEQIGTPFRTSFTATERSSGVHETNTRWAHAGGESGRGQ